MKKLLFALIISLAIPLTAEQNIDQPPMVEQIPDQFQICLGGYMGAYQKAMETCHEKGYKFFIFKNISYVDEIGQTLEFKAVCKDAGGDIFKDSFINKDIPSCGEITVNYEIICYRDSPREVLAVNVEAFYKNLALFQNYESPEVEGNKVLEVITMDELNAEIDHAKGPIYLDCYTSSCPPCKMLTPRFAQYSIDLATKGKFLKVNLETIPEVISTYEIKSMPTLLIFQNKKEEERKVGLPNILEYFEDLKN